MPATENARDVASVKEDLRFILDTGGSYEDAARRLGFPTVRALRKWLERHGK